MRAPFQILAIPYRIMDGRPFYCVLHRADFDQWQFIAGGGENDETPLQATKREICEEGGIDADNIVTLTSMCYIPTNIFPKKHLYSWANDTYVIPEYAFGFECKADIVLSHEHTEHLWLAYEGARAKLQWDSNRTALYELNCRLTADHTA
ncbi:MAG: NUDIX pyrophosphatase [Clostridia bacterium]|nr:NUDIX pyrophosphatase [Clostridia bacterium]